MQPVPGWNRRAAPDFAACGKWPPPVKTRSLFREQPPDGSEGRAETPPVPRQPRWQRNGTTGPAVFELGKSAGNICPSFERPQRRNRQTENLGRSALCNKRRSPETHSNHRSKLKDGSPFSDRDIPATPHAIPHFLGGIENAILPGRIASPGDRQPPAPCREAPSHPFWRSASDRTYKNDWPMPRAPCFLLFFAGLRIFQVRGNRCSWTDEIRIL